MNFILRGRCKEIFSCGGQKREFTWQVQGIGHAVTIVAGAVFFGHCQNVGRRVSFIQRIAFYVAGAGNPHHESYVLRWMGQFLRLVAFLELELEDAFPWPVQHFV